MGLCEFQGRDLAAEALTVGLEGQRDGVRTTLRLCMPPAVRRCVSIHAPLTVLPTFADEVSGTVHDRMISERLLSAEERPRPRPKDEGCVAS